MQNTPLGGGLFGQYALPSPVSGALAVTLDSATLGATAQVPATGALAKTLDSATLTATGVAPVTGTLAKTLDDATVTATGRVVIGASLAITLDGVTSAATGQVVVVGSLSGLLEDATNSATGQIVVTGSLPEALGDATSAGTGQVIVTGSLGAALADATLTATAGASTPSRRRSRGGPYLMPEYDAPERVPVLVIDEPELAALTRETAGSEREVPISAARTEPATVSIDAPAVSGSRLATSSYGPLVLLSQGAGSGTIEALSEVHDVTRMVPLTLDGGLVRFSLDRERRELAMLGIEDPEALVFA